MKPDKFADYVMGEHEPAQFHTVARYDATGDFIQFITAPDSYSADRIDGMVTVYTSTESGQIIGSKIKGVTKLLRNSRALRVLIEDGKVTLDHVIFASLDACTVQSMGEEHMAFRHYRKVYRELMSLAKNVERPIEFEKDLVGRD